MGYTNNPTPIFIWILIKNVQFNIFDKEKKIVQEYKLKTPVIIMLQQPQY